MDSCSDWCCKLTGTSSSSEKIQGFGVIVQFGGDLCVSSLLPGLKKAGEIKSKYALLTCHSIIPGSEESFKRISWSMKSKATGSAKSPKLNSFVSGAISCCGEKSIFGPGEHSLKEHDHKVCTLGLDFTLLFLDRKFESYIKSNPPMCSPPTVTIPMSEVHLQELSETLKTCCPETRSPNSTASSPQSTNEKPKVSGTFFISLPTIDTDATNQSPRLPVLVTPAKDSTDSQIVEVFKLNQDIAKYEAVKCISCTHIGDPVVHPSPGMPIAYQSTTNGATSKLTGILVQSPNCLCGITFYGIAQLIQGGPVGCLSVLINQAANRLWANRWSYLILPYLESVSLDTRHVLEILQVFLEKKLLRANRTDLLETREAVLTLIGALFRHFKDVGQDELMKAIEDTFGVAAVKREFLENLQSLRVSVVENVNDANQFSPLSQQETTQLVNACFYAVAMMLNFNDREGIVSEELKNNGFLKTLRILGEKYEETAAAQRHLVSIFNKCLLDLQATCKQDEEKLQKENAERVKELESRCSKEKERANQKEKQNITYTKLVQQTQAQLKDSQKDNQKLKEDILQLRQRLSSEQAVREREQRLSRELDQERVKNEEISQEVVELRDKNSDLENTSKIQSERVHSMKTELAESNKTIHTQTKELTELKKGKEVIQTLTQQVEELKVERDAQIQQQEKLEKEANDLQKRNEELESQLKTGPTKPRQKHPSETFATPPRQPKNRKTSTPSHVALASKRSGKPPDQTSTPPGQRQPPVRSASESRDVRLRPKPSSDGNGIRRAGSDSAVSKHSTRKKTPGK